MALDWFIFAIIATLFWSISAIITKFVRVNYIKSPIGYLVIVTPTAFISFLLLLFGKIQIPSVKMLIIIFITSIIGFVAYWLYITAIHREDISRVITLYGLQPLMILILATIFLKETLSIKGYIAFPLIITGSMLIAVKKVEERFKLSTEFFLILASILLYSIHGLLLKLVSKIDFVSMNIIRQMGFVIISCILFISSKNIRKKTKEDLKQLSKKKLCLIYTSESIAIIGVVLSYLAIQRGPVSLVTLIHGTEGLFVIILAVLISTFIPKILKEEITKKTISLKIISALLMIVGLYLITI